MIAEFDKPAYIELKLLKVNSDYESLVHRMNKEDDVIFDESVKNNGVREPLVINDKHVILDGHSRYRKAEKYKIQLVPYLIRNFEDPLEEKKYVIECNLQRRHSTTYQKIELGIALLEVESQIAKKRKTANLKKGSETPLASSEAHGKKGKAAQIVADKIKVSTTTMEKGIAIHKKAPDHIKEKLRTGKLSVNSAYQIITKKERSLPPAKLPEGEFDVILCDVPIGFNDKGGRGAAENHYPTMTARELSRMKIPSAKNSVIFFWMSPSIMYDTVSDSEVDHYPIYQYILDAWDFKNVKGEFVWDKEIIGLGSYNRNQHENCLIAFKGKMPCPAELFSSIIKEKRTKHSKKPESIYSIIEKMYPGRNYLELFGREKREGWTVFGNEVKGEKSVCTICWNYHNSSLVKTINKYIDFKTEEEQKQHLIKEHTNNGNLDELPYPFKQYFASKSEKQIEFDKTTKMSFLSETKLDSKTKLIRNCALCGTVCKESGFAKHLDKYHPEIKYGDNPGAHFKAKEFPI